MASDPTGTNPGGVLVRPAPDFFDDNVGYGGFNQINVAGNNWCLVSLFNNANTGIKLKVYALTVSSDSGGGCSAWVDKGSQLGSLVGNCNAIDPTFGMPFGQIFQNSKTTAMPLPSPFTVPATAAFFGSSGFDSFTYVFPFPMFIVPVGYALNVVNNDAADLLGASFWFHMANE